MSKLKERIDEVLSTINEEDRYSNSMAIADSIAQVAHIGQYRDNGEPYYNHPFRVCKKYCRLIGYDNNKTLSHVALTLNGIPYEGVIEVALLHDVVEDTDVSYEDIKELFYELGYKEFFDEYIDIPLKLITHDKSEPYETYIKKVMTNPISSLVKMLDLSDNLDLFGLDHVTNKDVERAKRYIDYFKMINDKYLFLAKLVNARRFDERTNHENDGEA